MLSNNNNKSDSNTYADFLTQPPTEEPFKEDTPCWGTGSSSSSTSNTSNNDLLSLNRILDRDRVILLENEDYIALDKPPDLRMDGCYRATVHKLTAYWYPSPLLRNQPNLVQAVEKLHKHNYLRDNELRHCHQLDYPTSGVLLLARNKKAARVACDCFIKRQSKKTYLAIVHGHLYPQQKWPLLPPDRLEIMSESERNHKKKRKPNNKGDTFVGHLPINAIFVKWQSAVRTKPKNNELPILSQSKRQRLEKQQRKGTVLEAKEFDALVDQCIQIQDETEIQIIISSKWKQVKQNERWKTMFETLCSRYNSVLKHKIDTIINPISSDQQSSSSLPTLFRIQGDGENCFYIHAACAQVQDEHKMKIHPDAMPFDSTLLPDNEEQKNNLNFKPALSKATVLEHGYLNDQPCTKVQLEPHTGRRHQLRLHMVVAGHPIVGDLSYEHSTNPIGVCRRMCLHAHKLSLNLHNAVGRQEIIAPDPFLVDKQSNKDKTIFVVKIPAG